MAIAKLLFPSLEAQLYVLVLSSAVLRLVITAAVPREPGFCKRGIAVARAYQHCFEQAKFRHPYPPLRQTHPIYDGCMVEAYANHTCSVVKPAALECFRENITRCDYRERLFAIADESGGACFGNRVNPEFQQHVLNFLEPVRGDSLCFILGDRAYECYSYAGYLMEANNPNLARLSVEQFIPVATQFFDSIYNCFVAIYKSNRPICENWQIPLLMDLQATALPSLFGMTFTADQMDRLELVRGCPVHQLGAMKPVWRKCYDIQGNIIEYDNIPSDDQDEGEPEGMEDTSPAPVLKQKVHDDPTLPPFLQLPVDK